MHNKKNQKKHFDTYVIIILQGFGGLHNTQLDFISSKKNHGYLLRFMKLLWSQGTKR